MGKPRAGFSRDFFTLTRSDENWRLTPRRQDDPSAHQRPEKSADLRGSNSAQSMPLGVGPKHLLGNRFSGRPNQHEQLQEPAVIGGPALITFHCATPRRFWHSA